MLLIKIWYIRRQFSELLFKHIIYRFVKAMFMFLPTFSI